MAPVFLAREEVLAVLADQIARYGGSLGFRDEAGLDSALAQPSATFAGAWLHSDLFEMTAAYLYHLTRNHPFVDGNNRVRAVSALLFLKLNGVSFRSDEDELADLVLAVACGEADKLTVAAFFRERAAT
jgi:death-on-curing protein